MSNINRRDAIKYGIAALATLGLSGVSRRASASAAAKVVIVGGGIGGVAAAKYLRLLNDSVQITIVEPNARYIFCPGSNEVVTGSEHLSELTVDYETIKNRYNVTVVEDLATEIDYAKKKLKLKSGTSLVYDKLIVSPGPDYLYEDIEGYSKALAEGEFPAAWHAGPQTLKLKEQISAMPQGGTLVISSPRDPYRCPPAPYERTAFIAEYFSRHNPSAKILLLDSKDDFILSNNYLPIFLERYNGKKGPSVEWVAKKHGGEVVELDAKNKTVITANGDRIQADVINIIPPEKAGQFAVMNNLADGDWVPFNSKDFSTKTDPDVYIVGDSAKADPMPKTGYIASNQAKIVAENIHAELNGSEAGTPFLMNNCLAMLQEDMGAVVAETFRYQGNDKPYEEAYYLSDPTSNEQINYIRAEIAKNWQRTFRKDIFS